MPNVLKLPGTGLLDDVVFFTAVDSAQEALTDMPPRAEEVSGNEIFLLCITFNHLSNSQQESCLNSHFDLLIA